MNFSRWRTVLGLLNARIWSMSAIRFVLACTLAFGEELPRSVKDRVEELRV